MKRRGFLKALVGGAVVAAAGVKLPDFVAAAEEEISLSEDALEDIVIELNNSRKAISINPTKILWPGIRACWDKEYANFAPEYTELFK